MKRNTDRLFHIIKQVTVLMQYGRKKDLSEDEKWETVQWLTKGMKTIDILQKLKRGENICVIQSADKFGQIKAY